MKKDEFYGLLIIFFLAAIFFMLYSLLTQDKCSMNDLNNKDLEIRYLKQIVEEQKA